MEYGLLLLLLPIPAVELLCRRIRSSNATTSAQASASTVPLMVQERGIGLVELVNVPEIEPRSDVNWRGACLSHKLSIEYSLPFFLFPISTRYVGPT